MRVVIDSLPIGTGHDIAARALAEAFLMRDIDVEFSHHLVKDVRWQTSLYFLGIRFLPRLYGTLFKQANHWTVMWQRHRYNWRAIGESALSAVYQTLRPDVVIATHPFALTAWSWIKERHPNLKLVGVLTDLSVHRFWYEPMADAYAIWLPEQARELEAFGAKPKTIWPVGIPIRSSFHDDDPLLTRYRQGPIVLLGGGLGMGPYYHILQQLATLPYPVLAVCGHNERLRWKLDERRWPERVSVVGYVEHMPTLLRNARLVVGKPGGVTAAEVSQSRVPWVVSHWIAGQEEINRDRLLMHDLAARGDTKLIDTVRNLADETSSARHTMLDHQQEWSRPYAAKNLVERILEL